MLTLRRLLKDEAGATAIEYGLFSTFISVAALVAAMQIGSKIETTFATASAHMTGGQSTAMVYYKSDTRLSFR